MNGQETPNSLGMYMQHSQLDKSMINDCYRSALRPLDHRFSLRQDGTWTGHSDWFLRSYHSNNTIGGGQFSSWTDGVRTDRTRRDYNVAPLVSSDIHGNDWWKRPLTIELERNNRNVDDDKIASGAAEHGNYPERAKRLQMDSDWERWCAPHVSFQKTARYQEVASNPLMQLNQILNKTLYAESKEKGCNETFDWQSGIQEQVALQLQMQRGQIAAKQLEKKRKLQLESEQWETLELLSKLQQEDDIPEDVDSSLSLSLTTRTCPCKSSFKLPDMNEDRPNQYVQPSPSVTLDLTMSIGSVSP